MRSKRKDNQRHWLFSLSLHLLLIVVFFMTPVGQRLLHRERPVKPQIIRKDEELAKVIDQIRKLAVGRLKEQVTVLDDVSIQMEGYLGTTAQGYRGFLSEQLEGAKERFLEEGKNTISRQETLLIAIRSFAENEEPNQKILENVFENSRPGIVAGQEEFRRALLLAAPDDEAMRAELDQIEEKQFRVFSNITTAVGEREQELKRRKVLAESIAEKAELEKYAESNVEQLAYYREIYATTKEQRKTVGGERQRAKYRVAGLEKKIANAKEESYKESLRKDLAEAEKDYAEKRKVASDVDAKFEDARVNANSLKKKIEYQEKQIPNLTEKIPELEKAIPGDVATRKEKAAAALSDQEAVVEEQKAMYDFIVARLPSSGSVTVEEFEAEGQP